MPHYEPSIGMVVDDGKWSDPCHLSSSGSPDFPICGNVNAIHCVKPGKPHEETDNCPWCDRPVCPVCRAIKDTYNRTGAWEGLT